MDQRTLREFPWLTRRAHRWYERRTLNGTDLVSGGELALRKVAAGSRVSVVLPALNEAETIGAICETVVRDLMDVGGLVDELIVVDGESTDGTADAARAAGAKVVGLSEVVPELPAVGGKGESLWRSLSIVDGDIVVWIDADIRNFAPHFVERLVAPLVMDEGTSFVKAFYRRPIVHGEELLPSGGGRVTELLARPMLNALFPELAAFVQPLSGEYAGRKDVLSKLPFFTGYSVEVGLLIDLVQMVGLDALAQVDLEERVHRNRPLHELAPMAYAIARTILRRAEDWGRIRSQHDYPTMPLLTPGEEGIVITDVTELERPPLSLLTPTLTALRNAGSNIVAL